MFIGHIAVALAAKHVAPRASLGTLVAAAMLPDIVWPVLVLVGVEQVAIHPGDTAFTPLNFVSYPWSHSLLLVALTGVLAGLVYATRTKYFAGALIIPVLAISHWVLDWLTHRPDLPLLPGGALYGLGLWNSIPGTLIIEGGLFAACVSSYARLTQAQDRIGLYGYWSLIVFLVAIYAGNLFGPPPPSDRAVAAVCIAGAALLYAWTNWADRHRRFR